MLLTPLPCHKLSHFLGPLPLERDVLYGRPLKLCSKELYHRKSDLVIVALIILYNLCNVLA